VWETTLEAIGLQALILSILKVRYVNKSNSVRESKSKLNASVPEAWELELSRQVVSRSISEN
jgi:hypothetical protein